MGLLPIFEIYTINPEQTGNYYKKSISPTSFDLDPYWFFRDNDFNIVTRDERSNTYDLNIKKDNVKAYVRTVGIRGPLMYSGWGYDICGLPAPSTGRNSLKFHDQTAYNRAKWKSGPIDLRWDDLRKVWVGGPEMIEGKMISKLDAPKDIDNPTKADMIVYRGFDLKIRDESVTLHNRNPKLSLSANDYVTAVKINYEWRPVGGGGCGGSPKNKQENKMIMVLGTYDEYKDCGGPAKPPTLPTGGCTGNHFCANQYAWSQYKVCGYKYYKVQTYKSYAWASELNSSVEDCGGAGKGMFYPAIFEGDPGTKTNPTAACDKGVRFWSGAPANERICGCPSWLKKCIKITFSTPPRPCPKTDPDPYCGYGCEATFDRFDELDLWDKTYTGELCGIRPGNCGFTGVVGDWFSIDQQGESRFGSVEPCYEGPDVFDPCEPCKEGYWQWCGYIDIPGDKRSSCGVGQHVEFCLGYDEMKSIMTTCDVVTKAASRYCPDNCGKPGTAFKFINSPANFTCCGQNSDGTATDGSCV